jgi:hypothetical protein
MRDQLPAVLLLPLLLLSSSHTRSRLLAEHRKAIDVYDKYQPVRFQFN